MEMLPKSSSYLEIWPGISQDGNDFISLNSNDKVKNLNAVAKLARQIKAPFAEISQVWVYLWRKPRYLPFFVQDFIANVRLHFKV